MLGFARAGANASGGYAFFVFAGSRAKKAFTPIPPYLKGGVKGVVFNI